MGKRIKVPANARIYRNGKKFELNNVDISVTKNLQDILILKQPKKGFHLHIDGLKKGVITKEGKKKKYPPLTAENFEKLKNETKEE